jgi:adenosylcobalamin-dependent ribonucleoside-triphosphate reductase
MFIDQTDIESAEREIGVPNYGALGSIIESRTYLRWLPDKKRRENFFERNARVVNYNVGLAIGEQSTYDLQEEADLLFKLLNELKVWGSGRTAWVAGTKSTELVPESTMNCSASIVNRIEVFAEAFHLLCLGCGFGFRIYPSDLEQIPELKYKGSFVTGLKEYKPLPKKDRQEITTYELRFEQSEVEYGILEIKVGDSRESWCSAIAAILQLYTGIKQTSFLDLEDLDISDVNYVMFNFDSVRPEGERIKGFGGIASGPEPLSKLLLEFVRIIEEETNNNKLRPINAMDMMCIMGDVVRSGNVRRSSLITLFHYLDEEVRNAKRGLWSDPKMAHKRYRSMSNNSILYDNGYKPSLEEFQQLMQTIRFEGEPGFVRADKHKEARHKAALQWRPDEDPSFYTEQAGITNPLNLAA